MKRRKKKKRNAISLGERFLIKLFDDKGIEYKYNFSFEWSRRKRYDFYLPLFNAVVEFHGKQHYQYVRKFHRSKAGLLRQKKTDSLKRYLAKKAGLRYIQVSYKKFDNNTVENYLLPKLGI